MSVKCNVLVPDGDSTWALSVLQCLSDNDNYRLHVLSNTKRTATKYSKYTNYYRYYPRESNKEWLQNLLSEIEQNQIDVVIPIAESEMAFCIAHSDEILERTKLIPLPSIDVFKIASDKHLLSDFCKSNLIAHPKSAYITTQNELSDKIKDYKFPILIKPLDQKGGDGIMKISEPSRLQFSEGEPLFIQELIEGYDIDCSVLCKDGKVLSHTIQKGKLLGHSQFAPQLAFDFLNDMSLLEVVSEIMDTLKWSGVAHLDLRYDSEAGNYKLIEINPRFWGSIESSKLSGINFPDLAIQSALGNSIALDNYKTGYYMRLKGVLKVIKRNPLFIFKSKFLWNNTELRSFFKDPLPTGYKFIEWLNRRISK